MINRILISKFLNFVTLLLSTVAIFEWFVSQSLVLRVREMYIPIAPSTSLIIFVLSIILFFLIKIKKSKVLTRIATWVVSLCMIILAIIGINLFNIHFLDIEQFLYSGNDYLDKVPIGRMSPFTCTLLILLCFNIFAELTSISNRFIKNWTIFSQLFILISGIIFLIGYLYQSPLHYGGTIIPIALIGALCIVLLVLSMILLSDKNSSPLKYFYQSKVSYILLRSFLPLFIGVLILLGWFATNPSFHLFNPAMSISLYIFIFSVITSLIIFHISRILGKKIDFLIYERKKNESIISEKNQEINNFFDSALDLLCVASIDGYFIRLNKEWRNVLGYEMSELEGKKFLDFVHPDDLQATLTALNTLSNNGEVLNFTNRYRCLSGDYKWIEWKSCPSGNKVYAAARDITERKKLLETLIQKNMELEASDEEIRSTNEELIATTDTLIQTNTALQIAKQKAEESENQMKRAQKTAKVGNWTWYIQENKLWWSDEMYRIFGIDKETFTGALDEVVEKAIHPEDKEKVVQSNLSVIHQNKPIAVEYRIVRSDGSIRYVLGEADTIVLDENGKSQLLTGIIKDISSYKIIQNELIAAKQKAEESEKLKSSFLQNMSHEVRTPLNSIAGFSKLITKPNQKPEKIVMFSKLISENSKKLIEIITDVIEMSQVHAQQVSAQFQNEELIELINNIMTNFKPYFEEKKIDLYFDNKIHQPEFFLQTDKGKLTRILVHLIDNALKFTLQVSVTVCCKTQGNKLHISVSDTGIGISPEMQEVIFEPFRQVETGICRNFGGNGLGLSLVKAYSELLHGSVTLQSELKQGTTFTLSLPIDNEQNELIENKSHQKTYAVKTILIAEDELSNYLYLNELLEEMNIETLYAQNGQQAIDMCKNNPEIGLILMDIKMPVMDGHLASKLIRKFRPDVPIIAQTAYALESEREDFIHDFDDYITKPIDQHEFELKLQKYIH